MEYTFKLFEFNLQNEKLTERDSEEDSESNKYKDNKNFIIQMFGIDEYGKTATIFVEDYLPFFYVKVNNSWGQTKKNAFFKHLKQKVGKYYENSIIECKLIERKKLYGFDAETKHRFIEIKVANMQIFNKLKNLWYEQDKNEDGLLDRKLIKNGYNYENDCLELYEANIPPLLRFFHIREISPSGWIALPIKKTIQLSNSQKTTTCDFEYKISYKNIIPLNNKETIVPYKILSFDIEASSSHGDFPIPIKSYKKLATNIIDYIEKYLIKKQKIEETLVHILKVAFGYSIDQYIDIVYPKEIINENDLNEKTKKFIKHTIGQNKSHNNQEHLIELMFQNANNKLITTVDKTGSDDENSDSENDESKNDSSKIVEENLFTKKPQSFLTKNINNDVLLIDLIIDSKESRDTKIIELTKSLRVYFPALEGDKVTFIGSTIVKNGDKEPILNHCIVLNSCTHPPTGNKIEIETYNSEKEVLLAWTNFIQRENPDIIIGYNIFSFDYEFMFRRAQELDCVEEFLKLSRNKDELCIANDYNKKLDIDRSTTTLASGTYDLAIIKMNGRLQVDMLNWFRRTENLNSYKLDYVAGHFIGDEIKKIIHDKKNSKEITRIYTSNMIGLQTENFIHFEEINHSSDYYKEGKKFAVKEINKKEGWFEIDGIEEPKGKKIKWGLAKDDVSPKDIFRMTMEGPESRGIIAKYCIQDCNLVHYLFNKVDVLTDLVEMSRLCSVPMSFLIFRGQGIKLTSYVAKKCREKGVLMPVINKGSKDDMYEGAIVLNPKCGLYLNDPVCVGDYASLYPSSMLSENLCPSSKVWTKTYDLNNTLVLETGEKDLDGNYKFDNLPSYEYVDVRFDTFRFSRKNLKSKLEKVLNGYKICRFAQPLNNEGIEEKAIMPAILEELLRERKNTRKQIPNTSDEFMKNILDKRQLAYKVTANSLYGQLGAKTSTFYEPDIAASTTATGRLLLTFAKKVVEECYQDINIDTKYGSVNTKAEYVYGDTDSVFFKFNLTYTNTGEKLEEDKALELSIDIAQKACHNVSKVLKQPHDFEYEKTFSPFCLLSKKRYVAIKYELDPTKGKRNEMGIVLKRKDNAPIVKDIYGGVIDILMKEKNIHKAVDFVNNSLQELVLGNTPIEKLIITKSLRSFYKNPLSIAHKVLADRIAQREPGNKPKSGDRIPFVYIVTKESSKGKKILQGEKIETPLFIKENKLQIDYSFYITNQIMKPLLQLFGLVLEELWLSQKPPRRAKVTQLKREIQSIKDLELEEKKEEKKVNNLKEKEVQQLIFEKYLRETNNNKQKNQSVTKFFNKK
jgi:DNA polymerase elongation subunit (family B)